MILDPRRLRFLLAVARYGGVLAAADELAVTASAVSQQLGKLERETGHALLQRTPTGSVLTPAGLALAEAAEDVERALALARARLEQDDEAVSGTVRIGGFQSFLANVLSPALPDWRSRHPGLRIETWEAEEEELMRALRAGGLDGVVVELDAGESYSPPRGTTDVPLLDEPWKLVVPAGALLAADVIDLSRLGIPWLGVDPTAASAKAIRRVRRLLGGDSSSVHTYYSFQNALALVAAGEGVTLVPSLALESLRTDGVDELDVPGLGMRRVALRHLTRSRGASPSLDTTTSLIREAAALFEPHGWEERYAGSGKVWSGNPNAQLVAEASRLTPGTALDVGCGEGGDVIWLAREGWQVTGADFSANGLARAARHAEEAGVADRTDWWQVDAREFDADGRTWDLVTCHFLHPPEGEMADVVRRLATAVAPGGHLLVVAHAPSEHLFADHPESQRKAMFLAADLVPALPEGFEPLVVEQRPRTVTREGRTFEIDDSTLLARRRP